MVGTTMGTINVPPVDSVFGSTRPRSNTQFSPRFLSSRHSWEFSGATTVLLQAISTISTAIIETTFHGISFYGRLKVLTRKTAIWALVTESFGQKFPPPQPPVTPSFANCSIHAAAKALAGTSANIVPVAGGGI